MVLDKFIVTYYSMIINGISLNKFVILSFFVSSILLLYSLYFSNNIIIKKQESMLTINNFIKLYVIRFLHYFSYTFLNFYPFLVNTKLFYDILYVSFSLFLIILYYTNEECILSVNEKQLLDPSYEKGADTKYQPYMEILFNSKIYNHLGIEFFVLLIFFMIIRTIYRFITKR